MYYFFEENMIKKIFLYIYYLLIIKIIYIMNIFFMDGIISFKLFFVIIFCLNVIVECKGFGYGINYFKFSNEDNDSFIYNVSFINFDIALDKFVKLLISLLKLKNSPPNFSSI